MILSVDIESYGAAELWVDGTPLPPQRFFHPARCLLEGDITLDRLNLLAAITTVEVGDPDPEDPFGIATWRPGPTRVFRLWHPAEREWFALWLNKADTIVGMNLQYDLLFLRADPYFRPFLNFRQTLVDLAVLNYQHSELSEMRSLKNIGLKLHTHSYDENETLKFKRFRYCDQGPILNYVAQDTHNTVLASAATARNILRDHPGSDKLSDYSIRFYSDSIWTCVEMSESGVCMSRSYLYDLEARLHAECADLQAEALTYGLTLEGDGSGKSKDRTWASILDQLEAENPGEISRLVALRRLRTTEKQGKISADDGNRNTIYPLLPPDSKYRRLLEVWAAFAERQKLLSSYTYPLLRWSRRDTSDIRSRLIEHTP